MGVHMKFLFLTLALAFSISAQASSTTCSSSDGKMVYSSDRPDGGPPRGPDFSLVVNGDTLINISGFGGANLVLGTFDRSDIPVWTFTSTSGYRKTTKSL